MRSIPLLSHLFVNQTLIDVCLYFVTNPGEEAYLARIVEGTGKVLIQVQRTLKRLIDCGLVLKTSHHKKITYKLNSAHIAYEEIRQLTLKAKIFSDIFEPVLIDLQSKVDFGFIYGSVAKGTNTSHSDIDLFLVGNLTYDDVSSFIFKLGRELVQEVNVVLFTPRELRKQIEAKNAFVQSVLEEPKIWLFGEKSEFEKIFR